MKRTAVASAFVIALLCGIFLIVRSRTAPAPVETPPAQLVESSSDQADSNVPTTLEAESTAVETPASTETVPDTIYISGLVEDSDGRPVPESLVDADWTTGSQSVVADGDGLFRLQIPRNTFGDGTLVIVRKANYQGRVYDVPFRGEVQDDKLTGFLDSRLGEFPVTGERVGEGEGAP